MNRKARALLPFLLAPCVPAIVACSTADVRADNGAQITPAVVARSGLPPLLLRPLSKTDAAALNRRIPFTAEPAVPAQPFRFGKDEIARGRALECLTSAIYYEAASESDNGQRAVAQVILNRVRHPAFPASICGVVYQGSTLRTGCQFSFTCDGSLQRMPSRAGWARARKFAETALAGEVFAPVGLATHYHADYVVPYWAPSLAKATQVGAHIFYRWAGAWGRTPSFTQAYPGVERDPVALRNIALLSHNIWPAAELPEKPRLALGIDPEVELGGILRLLASAPAPGTGGYELQIRNYFDGGTAAPLLAMLIPARAAAAEAAPAPAPEPPALVAEPAAEAPAVAAPPSAPPSLSQLVADFTRETKFSAFLRARRALYAATGKQVQRLAEQTAIDWETYTGAAVQGGKAVLSLAQGLNPDICPALTLGAPDVPVLRWPADTRDIGPAEIFVASGFARNTLGAAAPTSARKAKLLRAALDPVEDQVVAAVFARIAALSRGEPAGRALVERATAAGQDLVPLLVHRLRFFEQHRAEYPTLNHFLPMLIADLPEASRAGTAPAADQQKCGPAA